MKMFSPRTPNVRARPSPFSQQRTSILSKSNTTPRRSARNQNQSSIANQSFQGPQILEETSQHRIESFGTTLPVLITEALTLSDRSTTEITACIDPSGWAWLVGGRKLFVWRYKSSGTSKNVQCKELTLPPSDLAHSAERVCLIPSENNSQPAACVAVSPEGVVRYWPNIAFESSTAEISAELRGEECAQVINFQPYGCLLATTTSSLLLLEPVTGQASIFCKPLKSSQGLFSGISRRMSSFIFGASQHQTNGTPFQAILASPEGEYDDDDDEGEDRRSFYVLSGNTLSKWQVPSIGPERMLYQMDADRMFKEALARKVWDQDSIQLPQLKTWLIDIQLTREGFVMLGAGVNLEAAQVVYYALAYFETCDDSQPTSVSDLALLDYTQKYSEESEIQLTSYKLLLPSERSNTVFVYNSNSILMLQDNTNLDKMDLKTSGDLLLGAGRCGGVAVFFSNTHGIFRVSPPGSDPSILDESNNQGGTSITRAELTSMVSSVSKMTENTESDDSKSKLKEAFIAWISGEQSRAQTTVEELSSLVHPDPGMAGTELDSSVAGVSSDLIDDYPNADPRWAESKKQEFASSTASVIIIQQLKDKQKAHDFFINFLKKFGLWTQLNVVGVRNAVMPTRLLLCEHVEKLEAAIALRELHAEHHKMVDACISKVLRQRQIVVASTLTPQDMFYREVSNIHEIIPLLVSYEKEFLSDQSSHKVVTCVLAVNAIIEAMLHHALKYRQSHAEMYAGNPENIPEYIPWTATSSMRKVITEQVNISLQRGVPESRDIDVQGILFQNIVGLSDIVMDGYASQLQSIQWDQSKTEDYSKLGREFERERHKLITPLLEQKQYDRAASLAEKFEDFEMLMAICDATENQERLQRYRTQYADKGFAQFLFNWYMKEGKRGHLLSQPITHGDELSKFLDSDNVKYLSWLHEIRRGNFLAAHNALADLANSEKNFLSKKKTLLSLSKLAALAANDGDDTLQDDIDVINEELDLVLHQELLPTETIENVGMDPENMRVLAPEELIELYVSENNTTANELDVKKALDLLRHVDKDNDDIDYDALKLHIWCRAILMDSWNESNETDPLESNKDKIFFKTVDLVYMDGDLELLLPDLDSLMKAEELSSLSKQPNFKFLMRGGYEQIRSALTME